MILPADPEEGFAGGNAEQKPVAPVPNGLKSYGTGTHGNLKPPETDVSGGFFMSVMARAVFRRPR